MTLNENETIKQWAVDTFKGIPEKKLLGKGTRLFKFSSYPVVNKTRGTITPFWSDLEATPAGDWGLEGLERMAGHFNVSESEMARVTSAVKTEWNDLTHVHKVTLTESVYAWHGPAKSQHRTGDSGKKFPGTNLQYFIPNLSPWHLTGHESQRARG